MNSSLSDNRLLLQSSARHTKDSHQDPLVKKKEKGWFHFPAELRNTDLERIVQLVGRIFEIQLEIVEDLARNLRHQEIMRRLLLLIMKGLFDSEMKIFKNIPAH